MENNSPYAVNVYIVEFFDFAQQSYDQMRIDAPSKEAAIEKAKALQGKGFARFRAYLKQTAGE